MAKGLRFPLVSVFPDFPAGFTGQAAGKPDYPFTAFGEDFTVEDEAGRPAFRVDGKVLTLRKTFVLEDLDGRPLATIREPLISLRDTVVIDRAGTVLGRAGPGAGDGRAGPRAGDGRAGPGG